MLGLANFTMRGPFQAALPAAILLLLAILFPPLAWLSGAVIGLVFLRKGTDGGLRVFLVAALFIGAITFSLGAGFLPGLQLLVVFWVPVIALALALRTTVDLGRTLLIAGLMAMLVVLGLYLSFGQPEAMWSQLLQEQFPPEQMSQQLEIDEQQLRSAMDQVAGMMSGAFVTVMMIGSIVSLLVARYWQAGLYNPGGFREEFHSLKLGTLPAALAIAIALMAFFTQLPVFVNTAPIVVALFFFQGLAVFHGLVGIRKMHKGWLVGIYVLLLFLFPHTMILLGALGMADNWLKLRERGKD